MSERKFLFLAPLAYSFFSFASVASAETPLCIRETEFPKAPESAAALLLNSNHVGEDERFVRLIYAETLASNLMDPQGQEAIATGIAWVLRNRLRVGAAYGAREGAPSGVVLQKFQFRSSLGTYGGSRRKDFLCPEVSQERGERLWKKCENAWRATLAGKNPLPEVYNYYLPRHFENTGKKHALPKWAKAPNELQHPAIAGYGSEVEKYAQFWKIQRQ